MLKLLRVEVTAPPLRGLVPLALRPKDLSQVLFSPYAAMRLRAL